MAESKQRSANPSPSPGSYQPTSLIKTIESRIRDSVSDESKQLTQQTEDPNHVSEAPALLDRAKEGFVNFGQAVSQQVGKTKLPDSRSTVGTIHLQRPVVELTPLDDQPASAIEGQRSGSWKAGSQNLQSQDIVVVLSVDDDRQQQLEDTAALWQVTSMSHAAL